MLWAPSLRLFLHVPPHARPTSWAVSDLACVTKQFLCVYRSCACVSICMAIGSPPPPHLPMLCASALSVGNDSVKQSDFSSHNSRRKALLSRHCAVGIDFRSMVHHCSAFSGSGLFAVSATRSSNLCVHHHAWRDQSGWSGTRLVLVAAVTEANNCTSQRGRAGGRPYVLPSISRYSKPSAV